MSNHEPQGSENRSAFCGACGAEFTKTRDWQSFCSDKCRKDSWKTGKINVRRIVQLEARLERLEKVNGIKEGL